MDGKVSLKEKLSAFDEIWVPKIVGELNGQYVKVVKFVGEYVWHKHDLEDELFLVLKGRMRIELRERIIELGEGEFFIVPHGVEHKPVAPELVHALLFEPATTRNTGNVDHKYTIEASDLGRL
jgi:mannose-6-phosphate isomerase-like protein (cupin superfamily)